MRYTAAMKIYGNSTPKTVWYDAKAAKYAHNPTLKSIAIDMDEVMADTLGAYIALYNREYGKGIKRDDVIGKNIKDVVDADKQAIVSSYIDREGFFYGLEPKEGAIEIIRQLDVHYDVYVATAAMESPNAFNEKYLWLRDHFPFLNPMNFIFCGDKSILRVDYLIDDNPKHFAKFTGTPLLFDAARNQHIDAEAQGWRRVMGWQHVGELLLP